MYSKGKSITTIFIFWRHAGLDFHIMYWENMNIHTTFELVILGYNYAKLQTKQTKIAFI